VQGGRGKMRSPGEPGGELGREQETGDGSRFLPSGRPKEKRPRIVEVRCLPYGREGNRAVLVLRETWGSQGAA